MYVELEKIITGHNGPIYDACYDGAHFLYSTSADKFVVRWNLSTGKQDDFTVKLEESAYTICLINENKHLLIGTTSGKLHVIDIQSKTEIKCIEYHKVALFSSLEFKKQAYFALGDADGNVTIWNKNTFELQLSIPLNAGKIRSLVLDTDEKRLAIASQDGTIRILETSFFNEVLKIVAHENGCNSVVFDKFNFNRLISTGRDAFVKVWDLETILSIKSFPAHHETIYKIASFNDNYVTASRDKSLKIWNQDFSPNMKLDVSKKGHTRSVNGVIAIDQNRFFSFSDDATIRVWKTSSTILL